MAKAEKIEIELPPSAIHGQLPWLLIQTTLPSRAKLLFPVLWAFAFARKSPELDELASACSLSRRTIQRACKDLETALWMKVVKRHNYPNKFMLSENVAVGPGGAGGTMKGVLTGHGGLSTGHGGLSVGHGGLSVGHGGAPKAFRRENLEWRAGGSETPPLLLPPEASPWDLQGTPAKRSRRHLKASPVPEAPICYVKGWEGWAALVREKTGKPWAWTEDGLDCAFQLNKLVPPEALAGWQTNFLKHRFAIERGWDLRIGIADVNQLMPDVRPPKKFEIEPATLPPVKPVDPAQLDPKFLAVFGVTADDVLEEQP